MTRLIDELNALHASYVDAVNTAVANDDLSPPPSWPATTTATPS